MSIDTILILVALVLAAIAVLQSRGRDLCAWSVILLCAVLLPLW